MPALQIPPACELDGFDTDCTWEELHGYDPDLHDRIRRLASSFGYG